MNKTLNFFKASLLLLAVVFFVGCEEDTPGGGTGTVNDPSITLGSDQFITIAPGEEFIISVSAEANEAELNAIQVYEDGFSIPLERITYDGVAANANPKVLFDADRSAFSYDIGITAHSTVGDADYTVEVTDADGNSNDVTVTVTTSGTPPTFTIAGNGSIAVDVNTNLEFNTVGSVGTSDLSTLTVYVDGELASISSLTFAGVNFDTNPYFLPSSAIDGFEEKVRYRVGDVPGTYELTMVLTDDAGLTAEDNFTVTVNTPGTAVESFSGFLLANQGGPTGTGGADLDISEGSSSVGSSDARAEIRDMGINNDLPDASNWIQRVGPANNAQMRYLRPGSNGLSESFTFADISIKENLPTLFANGTDFSSGSSDVVNVGDMFIVERDGKYYAISITEISLPWITMMIIMLLT